MRELVPLQRQKDILVRLAFAAAVLGLALFAIRLTGRCLLPFVFALLTAALLQKPLCWLVGKAGGRRRYFAVALVVLAVLSLAAVILLIGGWLLRLLGGFLSDPHNLEQIRSVLTGVTSLLSEQIERWGARLSPDTRAMLTDLLQQATERLSGLIGQLFSEGAAALLSFLTASLPSFGIAFAAWIVASILLTANYAAARTQLLRCIPRRFVPLAQRVTGLSRTCIAKLLRAYLLLMLLTFIQLAVGLWLLRVPRFLSLAAMIALVDILPVLGTGTVLVPWAMIALLSGQKALGAGLLVLFAIITVVRNVAEPHLISREMGLSPLAALLAMYVGLRLAGLPGLLLFPPVLTVVLCLVRERSASEKIS